MWVLQAASAATHPARAGAAAAAVPGFWSSPGITCPQLGSVAMAGAGGALGFVLLQILPDALLVL